MCIKKIITQNNRPINNRLRQFTESSLNISSSIARGSPQLDMAFPMEYREPGLLLLLYNKYFEINLRYIHSLLLVLLPLCTSLSSEVLITV